MEQQVSYWMMKELSMGFNHIYETNIYDCFHSVCYKYNISKEEQTLIKEKCIERVSKALELIYSQGV